MKFEIYRKLIKKQNFKFSELSFNTCALKENRGSTGDKILRDTYLNENRTFTNILNPCIAWGGKRKDRVMLIKSLINT